MFVVNSCRKDHPLSQNATVKEKESSKFPVSNAMNWFNGNKTSLSNKIKLNSDASFLNKIADFTPLWDSARTAVDTNYYVVEAPAYYVKKLGFSNDSIGINGLTRLLILKNKVNDVISAVLMQVHGDNGNSIDNVHYMDIPESFSGNIFYTTLQGIFLSGFIYEKGHITFASSNKSSTKPQGPKILQVNADGCEEVTINWYSQTCYYTNEDVLIECSPWTYDHTDVVTYCPDPNPPGGGGAPGPNCNGGGGGGGGNPPAVASINGKLVIRLVEGGEGGGGGGCVTCQQQANNYYSNLQPEIVENSAINIMDMGSSVDTRTYDYRWHILSFRGMPYEIYSVEKGVHKMQGGQWLWSSLNHSKFVLTGFTYSTHANLVTANTNLGPYDSSITIALTVSVGFQCEGVSLEPYTSSIYTKSRGFNINDKP